MRPGREDSRLFPALVRLLPKALAGIGVALVPATILLMPADHGGAGTLPSSYV